jgi:hypothetical protein
MGELGAAIKEAIKKSLKANVKQGMICKIKSFDKEKMRADVLPLLQTAEDVELGVIGDVAVGFLKAGGFYIRPEYQAGDMVWITFSSYDIDDARGGLSRTAKVTFTLDNAMVVCGIAKDDWTPPGNFSESGLLIGNEDDSLFLNLSGSDITAKCNSLTWEGNMDLTGDVTIEGDVSQTGDFTLEGDMDMTGTLNVNSGALEVTT